MASVVGIDHLVLSVGDFARSKEFYGKLLRFLGFKLKYDYADMAGWSNGKTLFWVAAADAEGRKRKYRKGDIGFHHYAFETFKPQGRRRAWRLSGKERHDGDRSARRILWRELLCGVFCRSGRHETGRHDLGAAGEKARAGSAQENEEAEILIAESGRHAEQNRTARHHLIAAAALGGVKRI